MARCPHCGEVAVKGQERCFACGQKIHTRVRRGARPANIVIFVLAGVLVLAGIVGIIVISAGNAKRARAEAQKQAEQRARDSVRVAIEARRDSARAAAQANVAGLLVEEVNKLEQRFEIVREQVVGKNQPSGPQAKLISEIRSEVVRLKQLAMTVAAQPSGPKADSLKSQLRDGERAVRTLISNLTRAPKK